MRVQVGMGLKSSPPPMQTSSIYVYVCGNCVCVGLEVNVYELCCSWQNFSLHKEVVSPFQQHLDNIGLVMIVL